MVVRLIKNTSWEQLLLLGRCDSGCHCPSQWDHQLELHNQYQPARTCDALDLVSYLEQLLGLKVFVIVLPSVTSPNFILNLSHQGHNLQ